MNINPRYQSVADVCAAVLALKPESEWDQVEWLVKAGEGGSYQARWLHPSWGDSHPLAIDGAAKLASVIGQAALLGVRVTPYVVVRRGSMASAEQPMIRELVRVAGRCVLNVEPGSLYDGGPFSPPAVTGFLVGIGVDPACLEVCLIPRETQVDELGGAATVRAWTDGCGSASWECYGLIAPRPDETGLRADVALPRLVPRGWAPDDPHYAIPLVQRGEIGQWAYTAWADRGLEVWHLDGDV